MKETIRATLKNAAGEILHWVEIRVSPTEMSEAQSQKAACARLLSEWAQKQGETISIERRD